MIKETNASEKFKNISINRVKIAKYAGASGDYNPIHIDEEFAKNSPLKGVIAHGMLSMGFIAQYVETLLESPANLKNIKVQFRGIVRPNDTVSCFAEVESNSENESILAIKVLNQNQDLVLKGKVHVAQ